MPPRELVLPQYAELVTAADLAVTLVDANGAEASYGAETTRALEGTGTAPPSITPVAAASRTALSAR